MIRPVDAPRPVRPEEPHPSLLRPISDATLEDLMRRPVPTVPREAPVILLRRCRVCREYATEGSLAAGRSNCCQAPLNAPAAPK